MNNENTICHKVYLCIIGLYHIDVVFKCDGAVCRVCCYVNGVFRTLVCLPDR
jgi:hypothetical protein